MSSANIQERNFVGSHAIGAFAGRDCCFIALVTLLSSAFFVSRIGFYWDDWRLLQLSHFSDDQTLVGLVRSLFGGWPDLMARPVQSLQFAVLYQLFGLRPLGYHLVNTVIFLLGLCAFYIALRSLTDRRLISLATTLVYGFLPHYSTDRFWYANFCANVSMAFYFLSLYCDVRQVTFYRSWIWPWKVIASFSLIISLLSYEVFMPFFLLNPVLIAFKRWQLRTGGHEVARSRTGAALFYLVNPVLLILIASFKARTSRRAPGSGVFGWWLVDSAWTASVDLTFKAYLSNLPHILWTISAKYWNRSAMFIALTIVVVVVWYLIHVARTSGEQLPRASILTFLVVAGALLSGASYAYLYTYFQVNTGVNNRVALAAAVGVAISWASLAGLLSRALPRRAISNHAFCVVIALICGCGSLINNYISEFWVKASEKRTEILNDMKQHFSNPPRGSAILLTGFCAWDGPGIIFEATWDVTGALSLLYEDNTIKGAVMWPWLKATDDGVTFGVDTNAKIGTYPYASLYLYDAGRKQAVQIPDAKTVGYYVERAKQEAANGCLTAGFGTGLPIW